MSKLVKEKLKVGDKVITLEYVEDGCEFCATRIRKIYPDRIFNDITRYDLDGFEYVERGEFVTKKQAFDMLGMVEEDIGGWLLESEDDNLDIDKLRTIRDIVVLKIDAQRLGVYEDRAVELNEVIDRHG